jgi:hypothetical protein
MMALPLLVMDSVLLQELAMLLSKLSGYFCSSCSVRLQYAVAGALLIFSFLCAARVEGGVDSAEQDLAHVLWHNKRSPSSTRNDLWVMKMMVPAMTVSRS